MKEKRKKSVKETVPNDPLPGFLKNGDLRLLVFGGKGGTGKTTSAAATALYLARQNPEKRVVVVSSDPAHSLGDSFDCEVGGSVTPVKSVKNLWAYELDTALLLDRFKKQHKAAIDRLRVMSYSSDQIDIRDFLSLKLKGMEEMMVLLEVVELLRFGVFRRFEYDIVILDTAPTGHTLRLLSFPEKALKWIDIFNLSFRRYKGVSIAVSSLGFNIAGQGRPTKEVSEYLETISGKMKKAVNVLKDSGVCEFVPVTIAEELSVAETKRLVHTLKGEGIPVRNVIVNRVQEDKGCHFCRDRRHGQEAYLKEIDCVFGDYNRIRVPVLPYEVRGEERLLVYAGLLAGKGAKRLAADTRKIRDAAGNNKRELPKVGLSGLLSRAPKFIIFSGKGGVGKTTVSAATALAVARLNPDKRVLLFSTDPAHSLADSLGQPVGDRVTTVGCEGALHALEMNGEKIYDEFRTEYKTNIEDAFKKWQAKNAQDNRKRQLNFDRLVMAAFVDTYPPGLEEALALERIMNFVEKNEYDIYVFDTAPTGHLIELLSMPEIVSEWLSVTYKAILKYQRDMPVDNFEALGQRTSASLRTVRKMQEILRDPEKTEFVAVAIPEAMSLLETEDLLSGIGRLGIPCRHVVVNMVIPPTKCGFCSSKRKEQTSYIRELDAGKRLRGYGVVKVPLWGREIKGLDDLLKLSEFICGKGKPAPTVGKKKDKKKAGGDIKPEEEVYNGQKNGSKTKDGSKTAAFLS